ncbi:MAG: hypothetical protein FWF56_06665 [Firmicutes bacterium]|nr:hypothetical protein [Bacillota bacterium]MCL1953570.1 hypothetical protein [Bacillota bacterium]
MINGLNSKTQVNRVLRTKDVIKAFELNSTQKKAFEKINAISITHIIDTSTTSLSATDLVSRIVVYNIVASEIQYDLLSVIYKNTGGKCIFVVDVNSELQLIVENYTTNQPIDISINKPNDLQHLYSIILSHVLQLRLRDTESFVQLLDRKKEIDKLNREISKIQNKMHSSHQSKTKIALHSQLQITQSQLREKKE